jgi:hypothetical protein
MPSERRFRDDGTKATRLYKPDDGDDRMNENEEDVVHAGHRIKISKNPGLQADFVIRHPQEHGPLTRFEKRQGCPALTPFGDLSAMR